MFAQFLRIVPLILVLLSSFSFAQEFESDSRGNILLMEEEIGVLEVYYEYERDDCNCTTNMVTLYAVGEKFLSADEKISLQFLDGDVVIKNQQQYLCCEIQSGLYTIKINWSDEYDEYTDTTEAYYDYDYSDSTAAYYDYYEEDFYADTLFEVEESYDVEHLMFLDGLWSSNEDMIYSIIVDDYEGIMIYNSDDEHMITLWPEASCGGFDDLYEYIFTSSSGECFYLKKINSSNIGVYVEGDHGLYQYLKAYKMD